MFLGVCLCRNPKKHWMQSYGSNKHLDHPDPGDHGWLKAAHNSRFGKIVKSNGFWLQLDWTSNASRQKINLPMNQKGYDNFETTMRKLSARRIQICFYYFCKIHFWPLIFWNKWIQGPNKNSQSRFGFALSNTLVPRSQTLLRCLGSLVNYFIVS